MIFIKILKVIFKSFFKVLLTFFILLILLFIIRPINAKADYSIPFSTNWTAYLNFWRSDLITVPDDSISLYFTTLDTTPVWNWAKVGTSSSGTATAVDVQIVDNRLDLSSYANQDVYVYCYSWYYNRVQPSVINDVSVAWEYSGSEPVQSSQMLEQRYHSVNWGSDQFTKSNSLPLIYSVQHELSDFIPFGATICNSIQVDASTVGGDQLEWRLNLGNSGIDGQTAWLPIGFRMPVEADSIDIHSVQLRMKDPSDPTQYYPLDPSELSLCTVTYGYLEKVYIGLPPGEEVPLTTEDFEIEVPTVDFSEMDTAKIDGYQEYISLLGRIVNDIFSISGLSVVILFLLIFTFIYFLLTG